MDAGQLEGRKARAKAWFEALRDRICAEFLRRIGLRDLLAPWERRGARAAGGRLSYAARLDFRLQGEHGTHVRLRSEAEGPAYPSYFIEERRDAEESQARPSRAHA